MKIPKLSACGIVRYVGPCHWSSGTFIGVETDRSIGKHDGTVDNVAYFAAKKKHGLFVRPNQVVVVQSIPLPEEEYWGGTVRNAASFHTGSRTNSPVSSPSEVLTLTMLRDNTQSHPNNNNDNRTAKRGDRASTLSADPSITPTLLSKSLKGASDLREQTWSIGQSGNAAPASSILINSIPIRARSVPNIELLDFMTRRTDAAQSSHHASSELFNSRMLPLIESIVTSAVANVSSKYEARISALEEQLSRHTSEMRCDASAQNMSDYGNVPLSKTGRFTSAGDEVPLTLVATEKEFSQGLPASEVQYQDLSIAPIRGPEFDTLQAEPLRLPTSHFSDIEALEPPIELQLPVHVVPFSLGSLHTPTNSVGARSLEPQQGGLDSNVESIVVDHCTAPKSFQVEGESDVAPLASIITQQIIDSIPLPENATGKPEDSMLTTPSAIANRGNREITESASSHSNFPPASSSVSVPLPIATPLKPAFNETHSSMNECIVTFEKSMSPAPLKAEELQSTERATKDEYTSVAVSSETAPKMKSQRDHFTYWGRPSRKWKQLPQSTSIETGPANSTRKALRALTKNALKESAHLLPRSTSTVIGTAGHGLSTNDAEPVGEKSAILCDENVPIAREELASGEKLQSRETQSVATATKARTLAVDSKAHSLPLSQQTMRASEKDTHQDQLTRTGRNSKKPMETRLYRSLVEPIFTTLSSDLHFSRSLKSTSVSKQENVSNGVYVSPESPSTSQSRNPSSGHVSETPILQLSTATAASAPLQIVKNDLNHSIDSTQFVSRSFRSESMNSRKVSILNVNHKSVSKIYPSMSASFASLLRSPEKPIPPKRRPSLLSRRHSPDRKSEIPTEASPSLVSLSVVSPPTAPEHMGPIPYLGAEGSSVKEALATVGSELFLDVRNTANQILHRKISMGLEKRRKSLQNQDSNVTALMPPHQTSPSRIRPPTLPHDDIPAVQLIGEAADTGAHSRESMEVGALIKTPVVMRHAEDSRIVQETIPENPNTDIMAPIGERKDSAAYQYIHSTSSAVPSNPNNPNRLGTAKVEELMKLWQEHQGVELPEKLKEWILGMDVHAMQHLEELNVAKQSEESNRYENPAANENSPAKAQESLENLISSNAHEKSIGESLHQPADLSISLGEVPNVSNKHQTDDSENLWSKYPPLPASTSTALTSVSSVEDASFPLQFVSERSPTPITTLVSRQHLPQDYTSISTASVITPNTVADKISSVTNTSDVALAATAHISTAAEEEMTVVAYAGFSEVGYIPEEPNKVCQDAIVMAESPNPQRDILLMAVFDGHGAYGDAISAIFKEHFPAKFYASPALEEWVNIAPNIPLPSREEYLRSKLPEKGKNSSNLPGTGAVRLQRNVPAALRAALLATENEILHNGSIDASLSGCTGCIVAIAGDCVTVANVGDSRAILLRTYNEDPARPTELYFTPLSIDHKPDLLSETKRILLSGGRVASISYEDGEEGPLRIWLANEDSPGLAMSRSFCDTIGKSAGVISDPDIYTAALSKEDAYIILATDGLWEFVTNQEVANIIKESKRIADDASADYEAMVEQLRVDDKGDEIENSESPQQFLQTALNRLADEASDRWLQNEGVIDDVSIILIEIGKKLDS